MTIMYVRMYVCNAMQCNVMVWYGMVCMYVCVCIYLYVSVCICMYLYVFIYVSTICPFMVQPYINISLIQLYVHYNLRE